MSRISIRHTHNRLLRQFQQKQNARRRRRLFLERLEDRALLATMTWDGSSSVNWTDAANWVGDIAPAAGDDLFFPAGAANLTNNNDFPAGTSFNTILFTGGGYNITGNAITLAGGMTANNTAGNNSFAPAITLENALTLMSANAGTTLTVTSIDTGNIQGATNIFGTSALILDGSGALVVTGVIAGQGSIEKLGAGTATLRGANTYTGITDVRQGFLRIENATALGPAGSAETQIQPGAQLQAAGTFTVPEILTLREAGVGFGNGADPNSMGALRAVSGTVTWTGNMDLAGGNNLIGVDSGATLIVSGVIQNAIASANRLLKVGEGTLRLTGTQANVYRGDTVVLRGTLELGKTAGVNAIGGGLVIGDNLGGDNAATVRLLASNQIPHLDFFGVSLLTTTVQSSGLLDFNGFSDTIGNLTLTLGSTYSADVDLNGGMLTLGGAALTVNGFQGSSGVSPAATLADGTFDLGTFTSGAGGGSFKAFAINDSQLANIAPDLILSANITGTADIGWNKGGGGHLVLSGNNTNAGPVTLGGGNQGSGIVSIGSNTAFGTGLLAFQSSTIRAVGGNRTIANPLSLDSTIPVLGDLDITFTGPAVLTADRTIQVMDPDAIVTFAAPIGDGIFGSRSFNKAGRGTLQLTAANTFSGTYTINNDGGTTILSGAGSLQNTLNISVGLKGALRLDNTGTNGVDRINDVTSIALNGELALVGNATANTTEVTGPINTGDQVSSTITVQNTSGGANSVVLVGNALGISGSRLINFRALGGGGDISATGQNRIVFQNSPGNLSNGILVASRVTTATGIELATLSNAPEGVAVVPVPATAYTSDLANAGALSNVRITTPGTYTLTRSKQINSLILGPGVTINGADVLLNVTSGIFEFVGSGASAINVESINANNGSFFVGTGMTATIGGNIVAGQVNKGGDGRLVLSGDNTFSGNLTINDGFVTLQRSTAAGSTAGSTLIRQGGTLELQQTTFGPVEVGLEPLTVHGVGVGTTQQYADAVGAIRNVAGNNRWAGVVSLAGDATDLTGPLLLNGFPVINSGNAFFNVETGSRLTITGAINNGVEVIKRGAGTLEYAGVFANTNDATTRILEGTLELNKDRGINALINQVNIGSDRPGAPAATLRLVNSDQMRDDRGAFVHSSGLLDIGQTEGFGGALTLVVSPQGAGDVTIGATGMLTTNVDLTVVSQGVGNPTGATVTGGTIALQFQGIVAAAGARTWQVNDGAIGNDLTVTSAIVDGTGLQSVGINKSGFGTLELGGNTANTFTGTMSLNEGTLLLNKGTGTGGVNAIGGPLLVGDANVQSGFASSDIVRLLQPNQIPDLVAAVDVRNTGLFDLNNNNETIGNVDAQNALTINGGATISTGTGILTINGDVTGNPALGAALFTPVAVATINGRLNLGTGLIRTFNIGNRNELPVELIINADISGTAGMHLTGSMGLLLNGNNTFSGDTFRSGGDWAIGSDTAFGTAKVYMNGGHIVTYNGPRTIANEFVYSGATIAYLGGNGMAGSGAIGGGGNNLTITGLVNVTGGTFLPSTAIAGILEFAGGIGETLSPVTMRKQGAGTMILSSTITLSNGLEVGQDPGGNSRHRGGTVVLRGLGTYFNSNITIGAGGVFQIDNSAGNLTNRLGDAAQIDLFGGTLALVSGSGVQVTESIGQLRGRNTFTGTVQSLTSPAPGSNAVWRFTNLGLEGGNQGTAVKFQSRGQNISNTGTSRIAFNTAPAQIDGIIPFGVMQGSGGYDFATTINVGGAVTPFDNFLAPLTSGANFGTSLATATATVNVKLTASEVVAGPITANAVLLANGGIVISGAGPLTIDSGLLISNGAANQVTATSLALGVGEGLVFVTDNSDLNIASAISGAASSFAKNGRGFLTLSNNANVNTYAGAARVTEGILRVAKDSAFGTTAGNVSVTFGATLELSGGITIPAEQLTLAGHGEANFSTPLRNVGGTNTWLGNVVLNTNRTAIDVAAGQLNIGDAGSPGIVSNQGFNKFGLGTLQLAGNASNTNNVQSNIWQGTVELNKSAGAVAAINAIIVGDTTNGGDNVDVLRLLGDNQLGDTNNYTITVHPSGLFDLNNRTETIAPPSANATVLQLNIGPLGSGDVQMGATGQLLLQGGFQTNINVGVGSSGGSPVPVSITGSIAVTSTGMTLNVQDSVALEDLQMKAVITGSSPITVTGNNGRTVLDPRNAANAVVPNTYSGNTTISQGEVVIRTAGALGNTSGITTVSGGTLLIDGAGAITGETLSTGGAGFNNQGVIRSIAGTNSWTGNVTLTAAATISVNSGASLELSGVIGESGSQGLTKLMPGNLILSGGSGNTYTGTTTVNEGTLTLSKTAGNAFNGPLTIGNDAGAAGNFDTVQLTASNQIPDGVAITMQSTGRLNLGANSDTLGAFTLVAAMLHAPVITTTGAGTVTMNGNVTLNALANVPFTTRSPGATFAGALSLNNATRTFTVNDAGVGVMETIIDAAITSGGAAGNITSNGAGLLVLTNNNTLYTGTTTVSGGSGIVVRNNGALGSGTLNYTAASNLFSTNYGAAPSTITISNPITLNADLTIRGDNNLIFAGPITGQGAANRSLNLNVNNAASLTISGNVNLSNGSAAQTFIVNANTFNHTSTLSGFIRNGSGNLNHAFQKGGSGTLILSGNNNSAPNNDFIGTTTISGGILRVTHNNALGNTVSEAQTFGVTSSGGGSFTITYNGQVTSALTYTGTTPPLASDVAAALNLLPSIARTNGVVSVTSSTPAGPGTVYTVTFGGALSGIDVTQMASINVTAPVAPNGAIATTVTGGGGTFVNSPGTLQVVPGLNIMEPLTLNNNGLGNLGALRFIDQTPGTSETTTWGGNINFNANQTWVGVDGGGANPDRLIITGAVVSGGGALTVKTGLGELEFGGNTDNGQTIFNAVSPFDDGLEIRMGTVYFNKLANFNAIVGAGAVTVGDGGGGAGADRLIIMGASNDHIGGTAPLTVGPSGFVTFAGAATTEAIPNTVNLQRWMNSAGTIDTTATRTLALTNAVNVQNLGFTDGSTPAAQLLGQIDLGTASRSFNVADSLAQNAAEDLVVSAVIGSATAASGITKDGYGTMAVVAANTYQGTTTVNGSAQLDGIFGRVGGVLIARNAGVLGTGNLTVQEGGTLTLNNTATNISRIADTAVVDLRGALNLIGNSAGTTEIVGATTINVTNNGGQPARITVDSSAGGATELQLASLARGGLASAEFVGVGANLESATNSRIQVVGGTSPFVNGVLPWATVRGPAGYDLVTDADGTAGTAPYFLGRVTTYNTNISLGGIVRLTGGTHTLAANTTVDALLLEGGATVNSANFDLIVGTATAGLIVSATGTNALNLGATGELTYGGREPLFLVEAGSTLTANGLVNSTATLRLDRGGTLVLSGDNDQGAGNLFAGGIDVGAGLLRATHAEALGSATSTGAVTIRNLSTLSLEAPMTITSNRTLNVSGPGVNNNGALVVASGNAVTWGNGTTTLAWNQTPGNLIPAIMNIAGTLTLEGTTNTANSSLVKIGAGTLTYSGTAANANTAAVNVNEGTMILNKTGANAAVVGTLTIDDLGNFDAAGGGTVSYGVAGGTNNIADAASVVINDQGQLNLAGASDVINALTVNGSRVGSDNLSTGAGTLQVNGAMTVTGGTINGNIVLNNNLTYNSNSFGPGGRAIINGTLNLNNATRTFTINDNYAVDDLLINAAVTNGRLLKNGNGSLALTNSGNSLQSGINEIQTLTIPGTVTAFTLNFNGAVSQPITPVSAASIQMALDNLLGSGNALVMGAASPFTVEFISNLAGVDVVQLTSAVTGGSGTITHATTTAGLAAFNLNAGTLTLSSTAALGNATLHITGNVGVRPIAGAALNLASRIVVNPNLTTILGGRRDFGGTDAITLSGTEIVIMPSIGFNNNYQIDDPLTDARITGSIVGGARGVINTNIPLVKTGFGKLILSGVNTFIGHVNVSQGILNVRDSMALGSGGLPQFGSPYGSFVSVNGLAAIELEGGVTITDRTLVLSVVNPPGIVVASGYQNNFTGALRSVSGSNTWRGAVDLRGFDANVRSLFIGVDAGDLTIDGSIVGTNGGTAMVANNLVKIGEGTLTFAGDAPNLYTGTTAVLAGRLILNKSPGVNAVAGTLVVGDNVGTGDIVEINSAEQVVNTAQLQVQSSGQLILNGSAVAAPNEVQTITFSATATGGTWSLTVNGVGPVPTVTVPGLPFNITPSALENRIAQAQGSLNVRVGGIAGLVYTLTFTGSMGGQDVPLASVSSSLTPTITAPVTETLLGGGANPIARAETVNTPLFVVGATSSATVDVGGSTLVFNGDATVTARPGITTAVPAQIIGSGSVALLPANAAAAATRTITVNDAAGLIELSIVASIVDRPGGLTGVAASLTKAGPGRLSLGGANTFSGTVTISAGSLRMQHTDALGDVPGTPTTTTVNAGAALEIDIAGTNTIDNENIITNGFGILNGPTTPFFATILGTGAVRNVAGTNRLNVSSGNILTLNADSSFQVDAGRLIIDGIIGNTGGNRTFIKTGPGDLEMTGSTDNTYAGNTLVNEGKLVLNKSGVARAIGAPGTGELFIGDNIGGDNADLVEIASGGDQIQDARPIHIARTGRFNLNNFTETLSGNIFIDVGPSISGDVVTGTGSLLMTGSSIIAINQAGLSPASPPATLQGNFDGNAAGRAFDVRQGPANVELDVQAVITNATSITKNGRGTMSMSGSNTYTGTTLVNTDAGTLLMNTPASATASNITVNPNAVLGGTGIINGTVTAANVGGNQTVGGTINPGPAGAAPSNTGILTVNNNVTFGTRAELFIDVNGTVAGTGYDQLRVTGAGTVIINTTANNGSRLNGTTGLALLAGTGVKVIDKASPGAITNQFANALTPSPPASVVLGTRSYSFNYADNSGVPLGDGNDFVLFAIPSTVVWDGRVDGGVVTASNNWTLAANWVGDAVPAPGDAIMFNDIGIGNGKNTPFNDFPAGSQFGIITFANTSGSYTIGGNSITLALATGANIVSDNAMDIAVSNTFNVPLITATAPQTITVKDGSTLTLGSTVTLVAAAPLTVNNGAAGPDATGNIVFGGTVNGAAALTIDLAGDATFSAAVGGVTPLTSITIANADDVTFSSTLATTGNVTQTAGTGATTISGGTIGGALTINNESVTLAGGTTTVTGNTTLNATVAGVTQTAGALITPSLTLTGAGAFSLPQATNDFNTLTANVDGNVTIRDVDDLQIAGITTSADTISLTAGAAVTQTAAILGAALELRGAGPFTLLGANDVGTLAANVTEALSYADVNALIIGTVNGTPGITTTADNVSLSAGGAVTQTAAILAATLDLQGAGPFTLNHPSNDAVTLTGNSTNAVSYTDANNLAVGVLTATGSAVTINVLAGAITDANAAANNITGGQLVLTATAGIGTLADPLETTVTGLEAISGSAGVFVANTGALNLGGPSVVVGVNATAGDISVTATGLLTISEDVATAGNIALSGAGISFAGGAATSGATGSVTLHGGTGAISTTTAASDVVAQDLFATATTGIDIDTTVTNATLTNTGAGNVLIDETNALNLAGLSVANGAATINALGALTNGAGAALTVSGNASFAGASVALGNQAGDNLSFGSLTFNSSGAVTIDLNNATALSGASTASTLLFTSTGAITNTAGASLNVAADATLIATSITLGNQAGDAIHFGTLNFNSAGAVNIAEDSSTSLAGTNTAGSAVITSTATLTNAVGSSITIAGLGTFGGASVNLGNQAGDTFNVGSLGFSSTGAVNIAEDSAIQLGGVSTANSLQLTSPGVITNDAAASVTVTGAATLNGASIALGNQAGDTLNFGTLTFTATTGGVTIEENSSMTLSGASTAPGPIALTTVDAAGFDEDFVLPAGASITSTTSSVAINAGDNATIAGNVTSALAMTINVDFGDAESPGVIEGTAGSGGQVVITGIITTPVVGSGGGTFLSGNDDFDTFTFSPQTTTEFRVDGGSPTNTPTGDTLQLDTNAATGASLTAPGTIAPYNGPGSGTWTFTSPHRQVLFTNIEDNSPPTPFHLTIDNSGIPIGNIVVMRDASQTRVQIRDGSNSGPIVFQGLLTTVLSVRVLGSSGPDMVTVDDINTLPDFLFSVPGVSDNPTLPGAGELLFDGMGGNDTLVYNLNGANVDQTYAMGTGATAGNQEGEILSVGSAISLTTYFQNVELVLRIGSNAALGTSAVNGDMFNNSIAITANGALTRMSAAGYVPYDVGNGSIGQLVVNGLAGNDTLELIGLGSSAGNPTVTLNGGDGTDTLRVHSTSGHTGVVTLNGNAGNDIFQLFNATNTVEDIVAPIIVDGSDGSAAGNNDQLVIIDSGDVTADNVQIGPVNAASSADYRVEGINSTPGNDVVFRNIDTLSYTGTQGNDLFDLSFVNTTPAHDLSVATINGWLGADQFLLFTSDQIGGASPTPTGMPSGLAAISLNGDAPGNPNGLDGNDVFGQTAPGLVGTGSGSAGLVVADTVRSIRPSVSTAISINGGRPTGPVAPTGDTIGDVLNLDLSGLPTNSALILATVSGVVATTGIQPLSYAEIEDFNLIMNSQLINVQMGDTLVLGTSGADVIQFMRNPIPGNPEQTRVRVNSLVVDFTTTGKTLTFAGASNDYITMANVTFPGEIYGEDGDDYISGAMGNDFLVGGLGNDQINASGGDNIVWGDNTPSALDPTPQDSAIGGNDVLSALDGNDVFYGGGGNDQVSPGAGNDYIYGGQGNDLLDGHLGDDRVYGGAGDDVISGGAGNDLLVGGDGNDLLMGREGNDVLIGGDGSDTLNGDSGDDLLISGIVLNEASSWTSAPNTTTFDANTYVRASDNDAALMLLLSQWSISHDKSSLSTVLGDGDTDIVVPGTGNDDQTFGTT